MQLIVVKTRYYPWIDEHICLSRSNPFALLVIDYGLMLELNRPRPVTEISLSAAASTIGDRFQVEKMATLVRRNICGDIEQLPSQTLTQTCQENSMLTKAATDIGKIIKENNKALCAELAAGNAAGITQMYGKGAKLMPQHTGILKGKEIAAFWQGAIDKGIRGAKLKTLEVEVFSGKTAIEVGTYILTGAERAVLDEGKYVVIWKKDGKAWKIHRDILNSNRPAV